MWGDGECVVCVEGCVCGGDGECEEMVSGGDGVCGGDGECVRDNR